MMVLVVSCKKEDKQTATPVIAQNETEGLILAKEIAGQTYTVQVFTKSGVFIEGYNQFYLRVKNNVTNEFEKTVSFEVKPIMHMMGMSHGCPVSPFTKTTSKNSLYDGFAVFQMAGNADEYWELAIGFTIGGNTYTATSNVDVPAASKRRVTTFTGTDNAKYILALVEPSAPKVGVNNMQATLFKMESMMDFTQVNNFKVKIDPRMPSMGNHSSPNNIDLTQLGVGQFYAGKLSLTMTGYWKINLQLLNAQDEVLKGEAISSTVTTSSIFFELEF